MSKVTEYPSHIFSKGWYRRAILLLAGYIRDNDIRPNVVKQVDRNTRYAQQEGGVLLEQAPLLRLIKPVLAGYYLIANAQHTDEVVEDVSKALMYSVDSTALLVSDNPNHDISEVRNDYLIIKVVDYIGSSTLAMNFRSACETLFDERSSVSDKVIAIDTIIHTIHDQGSVVTGLFGYGKIDVTDGVTSLLDSLFELKK